MRVIMKNHSRDNGKKGEENVKTLLVAYAFGRLEAVFGEDSSAVVGKKGKNQCANVIIC
jgi:hypothetical protein